MVRKLSDIEQRVVTTLYLPQCQQIAFTYAAITIRGYLYTYVADRITSDALTVAVDPALVRKNRVGEFRSGGGTMPVLVFTDANVGTGPNSAAELQTMVHEATHAAISASRPGRPVNSIDNEFIAFLAGCVFSLAQYYAKDQKAARLIYAQGGTGVEKELYPLADKIIANFGVVLDASAAPGARAIIKNNYIDRDEIMPGLPDPTPVTQPGKPPMVPDTGP